jgi:hypothetical protein
MDWIDKRKEFQSRYDELSQVNITSLTSELSKAVSSYISKAGISQDSNNNPDYAKIQQLMTQLDNVKMRYVSLNNDILQYISSHGGSNNLTGILKENGELQQHITKLEQIQNEMKVDVDSAIARDELLRSKTEDISQHGLFILNRPLRQNLIPFLWALSILFIGVGLIVFRMTLPIDTLSSKISGATSVAGTSIFTSILLFITDKRVLLSLLSAALVVILFLSLKIAGVFGK